MDEESNEGGEVFTPEIVMVKSWSEKVNISQLCRICANTSDCLISIFEGEGVEHELLLKINKHLPLKVSEEDKLPKNVCYPCASTLIAWHDMSISCVEADKKLHSLIDDVSASAPSDDEFCDDNQSMDLGDFKDDADLDEKVIPAAEQTESLTFVDVSTIKKAVPPTPKSNVIKAKSFMELSVVAKEETSTIHEPDSILPDAVTKTKSNEASTSVEQEEDITPNKPSTENAEEEYLSSEPFLKNEGLKRRYRQSCKLKKNTLRERVIVKNRKMLENRMKRKNKLAIGCMKSLKNLKEWQSYVPSKGFVADNDGVDNKKYFMTNEISESGNGDNSDKQVVEKFDENSVEKSVFLCSICGCTFKEEHFLIRHKRMSHAEVKDSSQEGYIPEEIFQCSNCKYVFRTKSYLRRHERMRRKKGRCGRQIPVTKELFQCSVCKFIFKQKRYLTDHEKTAHNDINDDNDGKLYSCSLCSFVTWGKRYLTRHMNLRHNKNKTDTKNFEAKEFQCTVCKYKFKQKRYLVEHMICHSEDRPSFVCDVCGKSFLRLKNLTYHIKYVHLEIKDHCCDICGRILSSAHFLKIHKLTHSQERTFVCKLCDSTFKTPTTLYCHVRFTHSDESPFSCELCDRKFKRRYQLKKHVLLHTKEKKYCCTICHEKFSELIHFKRHKVIHYSDSSYACPMCPSSFKVERYLSRHIKLKHRYRTVVSTPLADENKV